ncbi:MAG: PD-(D/E)XK nuclease family transposase [Bacteroidota bacterium]
MTIKQIADPEGNKEEADIKINRVDILVEDVQKRLMVIELQYNREVDYFHRMLFATSRASVDHMKEGYDYGKIRKVYSINLLYFELGQGSDYVYHGKNEFKGIHNGDTLQLSRDQKEKFLYDEVYEIYPEYYIIKINTFDDIAKDSLDEWIYFFKHSKVPDNYTAKGLAQVKEKMRIEQLSSTEKAAYEKHQLDLVSQRNVLETARIEGRELGREEGRELGREEGSFKQLVRTVRNMIAKKYEVTVIADLLDCSLTSIEQIQTDLAKVDDILIEPKKGRSPKEIADELNVNLWMMEVIASDLV